MKFHFCQNNHSEVALAIEFKRTCALNLISNESALIQFALGKSCSHENAMPIGNFVFVKMTGMKSILV